MTEITFDAELRNAIRSGIYKPRKTLDLWLFANYAKGKANSKIAGAVIEILAFATRIDDGVAIGAEGKAFLDRVNAITNKIDPFRNPIFVRIPPGQDVTVAGLLNYARAEGLAQG